MRYLFFDIECCDGEHICEFGYVLTDTAFHILERDVVLINPEKPFCLTGRPGHRDLKLWYSDEEYQNSPTFPTYYPMIRSLIEAEDQMVIGHAIDNDAAFLRTACRRYGCDPINFSFYDSQMMFSEYADVHRQVSLSDAGNALETKKPEYLHRSDHDAKATMELVKAMCRSIGVSLSEFVELCPSVSGKSEDHRIILAGEEHKWDKKLRALQTGELDEEGKKELLRRLISHAEPDAGAVNILYGERICFDEEYENEHPEEMLRIVQLIVNAGGVYVLAAKKCKYFVMASEHAEASRRLAAISDGSKKTAHIKRISLAEFYAHLEITPEDVAACHLPNAKILAEDERTQKEKRKKHNTSYGNASAGDSRPTTIGASLLAQGIDLAALFTPTDEE